MSARQQAVDDIIEILKNNKTMDQYIPEINGVLVTLSEQEQSTVLDLVQQSLAAGTDIITPRKLKTFHRNRYNY